MQNSIVVLPKPWYTITIILYVFGWIVYSRACKGDFSIQKTGGLATRKAQQLAL